MKKNSEKVFHDLRRRVAHNMARLRKRRRLSFAELGQRAGLHWRHLQKIEAAESNVTLVTLARLADGLGVDGGELMTKAEPGKEART